MASSHISSHSYDAAAKRMTITFTNGHVYQYENVPSSLDVGMSKARSKGQYFHAFLKSRPAIYSAKKVEKK